MARNNKGKDSNKVQKMNKQQLNRRNSNRNFRRDKEIVDTVLSESNPYSWYSKNAQFTADAGRMPFAKPLGALISGGPNDKFVNPGVMRLTFTPTVGFSQDLQSPINRAAGELYTYIRSVMRVSGNYEAADLMIYLMALDSAYMFWAMMRRAYDTAQLYTPMNKYYPRTLLQYQGFDPSIANNLAAFRTYINKFGISLSRYAVPTGFDITDRHMWMCSGLYLDSETTRAQTYLFCPSVLWQYDNTAATGSSLKPVVWQQAGTTISLHDLEAVIDFGENLLSSITNDEDVLEMSGDLYRAYGAENMRKIPEVSDMERLEPIFDKTVLSQIENCSIVGDLNISTASISQDPSINSGAITSHYEFAGRTEFPNSLYVSPAFQSPRKFINLHNDNPTSEEVIEATRLAVSFSTGQLMSQAQYLSPDIMPADVINRVWIGLFNANGTGALSTLTQPTSEIRYTSATPAGSLLNSLQFMALLMSFDWAPMMYLYDVTGMASVGAEANLVHVMADIDNFTAIESEYLADMHTAAMYSLFDVPKIARM